MKEDILSRRRSNWRLSLINWSSFGIIEKNWGRFSSGTRLWIHMLLIFWYFIKWKRNVKLDDKILLYLGILVSWFLLVVIILGETFIVLSNLVDKNDNGKFALLNHKCLSSQLQKLVDYRVTRRTKTDKSKIS